MKLGLNLVGPQVRKYRSKRGWTQEKLAQKMQLLGWTVSRHSLAKLELRLRRVSDCELLFLAKALGTSVNELLPKNITYSKIGPEFQSNHRTAIFPTRAEK
ncbi:MAG: transcriptional regulator, family [Pedosphaera sp.]|nr:transcriptional regulator, family [Pedosphaera sp.]